MANIIFSGTMVRYPLGGMNQWILAWLVGLKWLGHQVFFIEQSAWKNACYDVPKRVMTGDCFYGVSVIRSLLSRYGLENNWCFIDENRVHHGMTETALSKVFATADVYIDLEWGEWIEETQNIPIRIFFDGDPGWFQFSLMTALKKGDILPHYDYYFTDGCLIGTNGCGIPMAGIPWRPMLGPVLMDGPVRLEGDPGTAFTTVMNWKSNKSVEYQGEAYGQKDVEFMKCLNLPRLVDQPLEVAVSGPGVPRELLLSHGWRLRSADEVAISVNSYRNYIAESRGEFSVVKNAFAKTRAGCVGDRPGYYMYSGRPVVVQDTGFSELLPCGEGLFAFSNVKEAADAIGTINADYERHSKAAREIAHEYLDAVKVLRKMLATVGVG